MALYNGFRFEEYDDPRTLNGSLRPDCAEEDDVVAYEEDELEEMDESSFYTDDMEERYDRDYVGRSHTHRIQSI